MITATAAEGALSNPGFLASGGVGFSLNPERRFEGDAHPSRARTPVYIGRSTIVNYMVPIRATLVTHQGAHA